MKLNELILVKWVDSSQPISAWHHLNELPKLDVICCQTVGWLVAKNKTSIMVSQNLGDEHSESNKQGSGFMTIPKCSVTKIVKLRR